MAQLRQYKNAFDMAGAHVVLVAMGTCDQTKAFKRKRGLPFTILSDPERNLYNTLNIGFMSLASTFSPSMAVKVATALAKGHGVGVPYGDIRQLPAVFIIESSGTIVFSHYGKDAADHPHPDNLLEIVVRID